MLIVAFKDIYLEEFNHFVAKDESTQQGDFTQGNDFSIELGKEGEDIIDLDPGPHYFYAILNIPDDLLGQLTSALEGQQYLLTKDEFEKIIVNLTLKEMTHDNQFMMTNITPPNLEVIYSEEQLKDNNRTNK